MVEKSMKTVKNKKEQIIVRLDAKKKAQLQEIADSMHINMSKLIRDKIDEIIDEYTNNKDDYKNKFYGDNNIFEGTGKVKTPKILFDSPSKFEIPAWDNNNLSETIQKLFEKMVTNKFENYVKQIDMDDILKKMDKKTTKK